MSDYRLNSARDVSESDIHNYIAEWQLGGGNPSEYNQSVWKNVQDNKKGIVEHFLASNAELDASTLAQKQQELETDLRKQERVIMLGKKIAAFADSTPEFGRSMDELSKWLALDDETKALETLVSLQEKYPDELTVMLLADTKANKGRLFESVLAATVDWMPLIGSPETYNPFSHLTLDARSDTRTPIRKIVVSEDDADACLSQASTDAEYATRTGRRIKTLRSVAEAWTTQSKTSNLAALRQFCRRPFRDPRIAFQSRSSTADQSEDAGLMGDADLTDSDNDRYSFNAQSSLNSASIMDHV